MCVCFTYILCEGGREWEEQERNHMTLMTVTGKAIERVVELHHISLHFLPGIVFNQMH